MKVTSNQIFLKHNINEYHSEGSYRFSGLESIQVELNEEDLSLADLYISILHSEDHINVVKTACELTFNFAEINLNPDSWNAARSAVALSLKIAQNTLEFGNGDFGLIRPPGHHASYNKAEGFCLFNNIACATEYLTHQDKKIAILDFDFHHGNGTQSFFYNRNDVFFISIHQSNTYPYSGFEFEQGIEVGKGFTLNIPLNRPSNEDFINAVKRALSEIELYKPDIIAISAGFDGFFKDHLTHGLWKLNQETYFEVGKLISQAKIPCFAVLEGGYHHNLNDCISSFVSGINFNV